MTVQQVPEAASDAAAIAIGSRGTRIAQAAIAALVVLALALLLHEFFAAMVNTWIESSSFGHGFLIYPACAYLAWRNRHRALGVPLSPDFRGLLAIGAIALAWLAAYVSETFVVQEVAVVALVQAAIVTVLGLRVARAFMFPLGYMYLAVPIGDFIIPELRSITAWFAVGLLKLASIPVFSDGYIIQVPNGNWLVADACSGIRYLISSVAVGTLFAAIVYTSWWRRAVFLALSVLIPIVANGIRAFGIIAIGYYSSNELATGVDHIIYGWIFFTFVTFIVLGVGNTFRDAQEMPRADHLAVLPIDRPSMIKQGLLAAMLVLAPVAAVKLYGLHVQSANLGSAAPLEAPPVELPYRSIAAGDPLAPRFANPDAVLNAAYARGDKVIQLHVGYYVRNRSGAEAVSPGHRFEPFAGWVAGPDHEITALIDGTPITVRSEQIQSRTSGRLVWYWYWVDGQFTANPYYAKLLEVRAKLLGGQQAAAIISLGTDFSDAGAVPEPALRQFLAQFSSLEPELANASRPQASSSQSAPVPH